MTTINCKNMPFDELNRLVRTAPTREIAIDGALGQRYIGCGLSDKSLTITGTPGNALGADACYIATAALLALGCHLCRNCQSGLCNWGIATQRPELVRRLDPDEGAERLVNLMSAWKHEIKELMGGMGINSIEALRGNRLMLRGVGLNEKELEILGVSHAGE